MARLFKYLGCSVLALVLLCLAAAALVLWKSNALLARSHAVAVGPVPASTGAEAIRRGEHIARTRGCADCHGADFGGAKVIDDIAMGRIYGPNLTRGTGGLPSGFGDEDYVRAIRHGIGPGGRALFLMPAAEYAHFTDDDLGAVIAFLKALPPVNRASPSIAPGPVARLLLATGRMRLAADEIDHAGLRPSTVRPGATADYGRYLAAACMGCHGANFSGGRIAVGPPGWPAAANLTPEPGGPLAAWTEAEFIATLRSGRRPDGSALDPVMPRTFGQMDNVELEAIWLFLKTLPPAPTGVRR